MINSREIDIPTDLLGTAEDFSSLLLTQSLSLHVHDNYQTLLEKDHSLPEVVAVQRLITLARAGVKMRVTWGRSIGKQVFTAPSLFPLLAVLLILDCTSHSVLLADGTKSEVDVHASRKAIHNFRPMADLFSDSQIIICSDSRGHGRPKFLYKPDGTLISRTDFETFVERLLSAQIGINAGTAQSVKFSQNVSTIVAELFENTDIHGKHDLNGVPFETNGIRGMVFKRINLPAPVLARSAGANSSQHDVDSGRDQERRQAVALEVSVFDSGIGYYSSYMREQLKSDTTLNDEWRVVHKCLERHYDVEALPAVQLPDTRTAHTGMGLYEVLRALQFLKGKFEVRSGRTYGFRTFLQGDTQFQIEAATSITRPGMPKPVLLDQGLKYVRVPTPNELLVGSTVRVLIPLS